MLRLFIKSIWLLVLIPIGVIAENNKPVPYSVFSNKAKALDFAEQEKNSGNRTNITTQIQTHQRYVVYLKGYAQWSAAFKQAQALEQMGYKNIQVVKGSPEKKYSIIIAQLLSKKKAGEIFNKLRGSGLKNIRVKADTIKLTRYIVTVHQLPVPTQSDSITKIPQPLPKTAAKSSNTRQLPAEQVPQTVIKSKSEDDTLIISEEEISNNDMIIVMSDATDVTFDIEIGDSLENSNVDWAIDKMILEEELFSRSSSDATNAEYAHVSSHVNWRISDNWDVQLAARVDAYKQHGKRGTDINDLNLDYEDNYLRYRDENVRLTLGTQTIRWGRVDIIAPTDNMVTMDLSRGVLPNWDDLYRASLAMRAELFSGKNKLDFVYLPKFREAELPDDKENVWYPINFRKGEILGGKITPISKTILQNARVDDKVDGEGGMGLRFSSNINAIDYALTVQRVRLSAPSYKINEKFRQDLFINPQAAIANQYSYGYTYTEEHPRNWIVGGDMAFQWKDYTLRFEGAWFSDMPATTKNLEYKKYDGFRWASGVEFYPGDADTRVILQLSGTHIDEKEKIVDRDNSLTLAGESESLFYNNRWRFNTKFSLGLDMKDIYVSPEIAFLGWEPFEIYTAVHYFDGSDRSMGGFYRENSMITFGWRGRY